MQPSQDNNDQNQDRSLFENTPDYLGLAPVQEKRTLPIRKIIVLMTTVILVIGVVVTLVAVLTSKTAPEKRLMSALKQSLSVKYVNRTAEYSKLNGNRGTVVSVKSDIDITNPYKVRSVSNIDVRRKIMQNGEILNESGEMSFFQDGTLTKRLVKLGDTGDWEDGSVSPDEDGEVRVSSDAFSAESLVYFSRTFPYMGNFDEKSQNIIMESIESGRLFSIVGFDDDKDTELLAAYVRLNRDEMDAVNKQLADANTRDAIVRFLPAEFGADDENVILWISQDDTLRGVEFLTETVSAGIKTSVVVKYEYKNEMSIHDPTK